MKYKYLGKGLYQEVQENELENLSQEDINQLKEMPSTRNSREPKDVLLEIKKTIYKSGYKITTVINLVNMLGNKKRSPQIVDAIQAKFIENGLFIFPKLSMELKSDEILRIYDFPVESLGDLFEEEEKLEDYLHINNHFNKLNIQNSERQFSPDQTRDRLDFKCIDVNGNHIALELKHKDGGKSSVEQVLRYLGMLKQQFNNHARGILVTGIRSVSTAKALYGMTEDQKKVIDWYLYKYDKQNSTLDFEKVEYELINKYLNTRKTS